MAHSNCRYCSHACARIPGAAADTGKELYVVAPGDSGHRGDAGDRSCILRLRRHSRDRGQPKRRALRRQRPLDRQVRGSTDHPPGYYVSTSIKEG
jgi:hypothetical protein